MADQQFQDFNPSTRRHVHGPESQLGEGLAPNHEAKLPVTLQRSRVAHDGAEMYDDPNSFVTTSAKEAATAASPLMSSYQAMQAGMSLEPKKRTGKRCVAPQDIPGASKANLFMGSGPGAGSTRTDPAAALVMGTTKQSPHIPGYCGHIPKTATTADAAPQRSFDKSLVVENYKPYGGGYTGRNKG